MGKERKNHQKPTQTVGHRAKRRGASLFLVACSLGMLLLLCPACARYHQRAFLLDEWDAQRYESRPYSRLVSAGPWQICPEVCSYWGSFRADPSQNTPFDFELTITDSTGRRHAKEDFTAGVFRITSMTVIAGSQCDTMIVRSERVIFSEDGTGVRAYYGRISLDPGVDRLEWLIPFRRDYPDSSTPDDTIRLRMHRYDHSYTSIYVGD